MKKKFILNSTLSVSARDFFQICALVLLLGSVTALGAFGSRGSSVKAGEAAAVPDSPALLSPAVMSQKLQQYNEMSRKVHDRQFRGGGDEDNLKVAASLPKPERGAIAGELQAKDNVERGKNENGSAGEENAGSGETPAEEATHD